MDLANTHDHLFLILLQIVLVYGVVLFLDMGKRFHLFLYLQLISCFEDL